MIRKLLLSLCFFQAFLAMGTAFAIEGVFYNQPPHMVKAATHIEEDGTIHLEGGVSIVLSGIRWWLLFGDGGTNNSAQPKDLLEKYIAEGALNIYLEPTPKDRYGRLYAQVISANGVWIQKNLLEQGLAMFWPNSGHNDALRQAENKARSDVLGRWGWQQGVMKCHNWQGFWSEGMAIIRGHVKEVKQLGNTIYMNFGEEWWRDFSIQADARWATENSWSADVYLDQYIEIRGWLYWQGGPQIKLEHRAQITPLNEGGMEGASCLSPQGGEG